MHCSFVLFPWYSEKLFPSQIIGSSMQYSDFACINGLKLNVRSPLYSWVHNISPIARCVEVITQIPMLNVKELKCIWPYLRIIL